MFLSRRTRNHIPGVDLLDGTFPALHEAETGGHNERLTEGMGMPCRAGPRLERDARPLHAPRSSCLEQGSNATLPGDPFPGPSPRRPGSASLDLHVFHALPSI